MSTEADRDKFELYQQQVGTNVSFTSFMTAVVVFFTGLLITSFNSYDISLKIPIAFLIISIFGFLYSTLIFANASERVSRKDEVGFRRHMRIGDVLGEYLGVYLLIISIPLVINIITSDNLLRVVTIVSAVVGLAIYQFSDLSLIERHFEGRSRVLSFTVILLEILVFVAQIYKVYFTLISIIFLVYLLSVTYLAIRKKNA